MTTDKICEGINNALMNLEMIAAGRDTVSGDPLSLCDMRRLAADAITALQAEGEKLRTSMIEAKSYIDHYMYGGSSYREPAAKATALIDAALAPIAKELNHE